MNPVLISRHVSNEGPGYLADYLDRHGIDWKLVRVDQGQNLPVNLSGFSGLVFMGGAMSVNDSLPWIEDAVNLIQQAYDSDMPVLGHCLGGQLMAKALGGTVTTNPVKEYGWHKVDLCRDEITAGWLGEHVNPVDAFHWHGETFSLPDKAVRILTNRHCRNQGFVINNFLALQCHIEMDETLIDNWINAAGNDLPTPSDSVQSAEQMREQLDERLGNMRSLADQLYSHWISCLK
jgi:GMP synthase-like glutamine amidotransferase